MIEFRTARPQDAASIAKIHAHNWQTTYRGIYSDTFLDNDVTTERATAWRQRLESPAPNQVITVALLDGEVSGFACLFLEHDPVYGALLDNLHVAAEARGTGIGKQLMGKCAGAIVARSARHNMYLWVYVKNVNAIAVYDRLGGMNAGTEPQHHVDGSVADAYRYVWQDASILL